MTKMLVFMVTFYFNASHALLDTTCFKNRTICQHAYETRCETSINLHSYVTSLCLIDSLTAFMSQLFLTQETLCCCCCVLHSLITTGSTGSGPKRWNLTCLPSLTMKSNKGMPVI